MRVLGAALQVDAGAQRGVGVDAVVAARRRGRPSVVAQAQLAERRPSSRSGSAGR